MPRLVASVTFVNETNCLVCALSHNPMSTTEALRTGVHEQCETGYCQLADGGEGLTSQSAASALNILKA